MACPGSATDVIRGLGRRPWCALGMLAGSKQGLARGWWYVGRTSVGLRSDFGRTSVGRTELAWGCSSFMVRRMRGSVGGRRCARRGRVGGFWEWIWVLWEWIWVLCDVMCVFWAGRR